jgi:hypothetical protein
MIPHRIINRIFPPIVCGITISELLAAAWMEWASKLVKVCQRQEGVRMTVDIRSRGCRSRASGKNRVCNTNYVCWAPFS